MCPGQRTYDQMFLDTLLLALCTVHFIGVNLKKIDKFVIRIFVNVIFTYTKLLFIKYGKKRGSSWY